jgi:AhpD family alkylhydroperoxidase
MLGDLVARHGEVGDMVRTMANSPAVLGGYLQLSRSMKRAKLSRRISERISIAVQVRQGCGLCLESHEAAARSLGLDDDEIDRARRGTSGDPAIAPMVAFGLQVYVEPASIVSAQVDELRRWGYSDREIADVVGVVALNVLTGAFNLAAGLRPTHS